MKNKKGFTLMEMMVVVLIIAGLAAISYPLYTKSITKARVAEAFALSEIVREAQQRNLALSNTYFSAFTNAHVSGRTRLIKSSSNDVNVENGQLKRDAYTVTIANVTGSNAVRNGCIIVEYQPDGKTQPVFTIYTHVEDSRIWCEEVDEGSGICSAIPTATLETTAPDCSRN